MRILHVSMGLPPFRTGGLNRYCADLMAMQKEQGEEVGLLYPGEFALDGKTAIRKTKDERFLLFRIVNPLPLALTYGIADPQRYMAECKTPDVYVEFLRENKPDVIHVHSFQGIHKEFFKAAHDLNIKMIFTTHDYYPFCPVCVLLQRDGSLCTGPDPQKCACCNSGRGLSPAKEILMQSRIYEHLKYSPLVTKIRSQQNKSSMTEEKESSAPDDAEALNKAFQYEQLQTYYLQILEYMDCIHCNSRIAMNIYKQYVLEQKCKVLGITHAGLSQSEHKLNKQVLRIGYVGGLKHYKGINILLQAVECMEKSGITNYELWLYGADYGEYAARNSHIRNGGVYTRENEKDVWNSFDVLVVPSQCYETYGFVVAEALAHGVGVVCSDLVGASQLLPETDIFVHDSPQQLAERLSSAHDIPKLPEEVFQMDLHAAAIKSEFYE